MKSITHTLRCSSRAASVPPHWYSLFLLNHISQVCQRTLKLPAIDSLCCFACVFEGDSEVGATGTSGFRRFDRRSCVSYLIDEGS